MREFKAKFVPDKMVNQLILLFIMEKMEIPLTETSLLDICTNQRDYLSYMDFKDVLENLLTFNFVKKITDTENEHRYKITETGINCLGHFYTKIPLSYRNDITDFAKENRTNFKRNQEYVTKYLQNSNNNTYTAIFRIVSPLDAATIFEIKMQYPSKQIAIDACKKWRDNATKIYTYVFEKLGE